MSSFDALGLRNRRAVPWDSVPRETPDAFGATVVDAVGAGWSLCSLFGMPDGADDVRIVAILGDAVTGQMGATSTRARDAYPALTPACPQASVFEREIAEQTGITPVGHPSLTPLRRHPPDHAAPVGAARRGARSGAGEPGEPERAGTAFGAAVLDRDSYPFPLIDGEDVHEVAVGPVHAGIIEPGHFRFQAYGEDVLHLEIVLGYQHRGVECLLETLPRDRAMLVAESIAGDTVIGHGEAYCGAIEALARSRKTPRAQTVRGIALELERLANHIGDLGAIAGDIAFQPGAAYLGRMRGECLNLLMLLSGNRYGRGLIRPGGTQFDIPAEMATEMRDRLVRLGEELRPVMDLLFGDASVQARLEEVGVLTPDASREMGCVGPVARACDVARDIRHDHPYGVFRFAHIPVATAWTGDVLARAMVRRLEIERSLDFVREQVMSLPRGTARAECGALRPNEIAVAMTEGWRGEIVHVVITDERGDVRRHKVTDPSLRNWPALARAMPGNQISDFPLCNKSFNLSYAGHDL
jgi:Ni,Fe-hydrogenase III large subunit